MGAAADARAGPAPARNGAVAGAEPHTSSLADTKPLAHAGADERAADADGVANADGVADADVLVHVPADEQPRVQPAGPELTWAGTGGATSTTVSSPLAPHPGGKSRSDSQSAQIR